MIIMQPHAQAARTDANGQPTVREGVQGVRWVKVVQGGGTAGCRARRIRDTSVAHVCQLVNSALKRLLIVIISQAQLSEGRAGARRVSHDSFVLISGR